MRSHRPASLRFGSVFPSSLCSTLLGLTAGILLSGGGLTAQASQAGPRDPALPDSAAMVEEVRQLQVEFEAFRESRISPRTRTSEPRCDVRIGRICHWFGGAEEADFPPEPAETGMARQALLGSLLDVRREVGDPWVLGQIVQYLAEEGRFGQAERLAEECGLVETWWCHALRGYALHLQGEFVAAEAAFEEALLGLPEIEDRRWRAPRFVLSGGARGEFEAASPQERGRLWDRLWRFSNPLFMVEGNDRLTEHYSRLVLVRIREDSGHPFQIAWGEDMEEALVRYGREIGWSRTRSASTGRALQDSRRVLGHHDPASRGYLFPEEFLSSPADVPPEAWITAPREARTWYAPPYAPDFRGLETQVARFQRGDSLLVVGAFRPAPESAVSGFAAEPEGPSDPFASRDPFAGGMGGGQGPARTGLFLIPEDGGEIHSASGQSREDVLTLRAPAGRYLSSLEVFEEYDRAAWRARQGVTLVPLSPGRAGISDVILLREGAPMPSDLEEAIPQLRPGIRVARGEAFVVAWEVYGMGVEDEARITMGFTRGRPGFLQRVGEYLGIVDPDVPLEISFQEMAPDEVETVFRAIEVALPQLEADEYTLHVQLDLPGHEPVIASRPILVEER